jgi:hypothetical protein
MANNGYHQLFTGVLATSFVVLVLFAYAPKPNQKSEHLDSFISEIDKKDLVILKEIIRKEKYKKQYVIDRKLPNRLDISSLLNEFNFKTMIEIGVKDAGYAYELLQKWSGFEHYYGIDPYEKQNNYNDIANRDQSVQDRDYLKVRDMLITKFGKEKIAMVRNYSTSVVGLFKKGSIDFIYVDARHDYCGVTEDINAYYPILRCGGLFAGHDYEFKSPTPDLDWDLCGNGSRIEGSVKRAVLEFAERNAIPFIHTTQEEYYKSWYFFKNC